MRKKKYKYRPISQIEGTIYFVEAAVGAERLVKIGFTQGSVENRLHTLQLGSPVPLTLRKTFRGFRSDEVTLHHIFEHLRSHREWFLLAGDLAAYLDRICLMQEDQAS